MVTKRGGKIDREEGKVYFTRPTLSTRRPPHGGKGRLTHAKQSPRRPSAGGMLSEKGGVTFSVLVGGGGRVVPSIVSALQVVLSMVPRQRPHAFPPACHHGNTRDDQLAHY